MNKTVLMMLAAATLVVQNGLAYDDPDEFEVALARASQSKPRLKAAGATLLSATGDDNTYWATGDLNVTGRYGEPLYFTFEIPKNYTHITSATLTMDAYDVDAYSTERDEVYFNDVHVGTLTGDNNIRHVNTFPVPASAIKSGANNLCIRIEVSGWITRISDVKLVIDGEVEYINLEASQNYDDRIQLTWKVSPGLSGERCSVYRGNRKDGAFYKIAERIQARNYSDFGVSAGPLYYYYVVSESGIVSEVISGKRITKYKKPEISLESISHTKWFRGENDFVAGDSLQFSIRFMTKARPTTISKVEIFQEGVSSPAHAGRKKIFSYNFPAETPLSDNVVNSYIADLPTGSGSHGMFRFRVGATLCVDGKTISIQSDNVHSLVRPIYFYPDIGDDAITPNWFRYWAADGACPSLNQTLPRPVFAGDFVCTDGRKIDYRTKYKVDAGAVGQYSGGGDKARRDDVYIMKRDYGKKFSDKASITVGNREYDMLSSCRPDLFSVDVVEKTIAHETRHRTTLLRYISDLSKHGIDYYQLFNGAFNGQYSEEEIISAINPYDHDFVIVKPKLKLPQWLLELYGFSPLLFDTLTDEYEAELNSKYGISDKTPRFNPRNADSFSLSKISWGPLGYYDLSGYDSYGDNELLSRMAEDRVLGCREKDWSYQGYIWQQNKTKIRTNNLVMRSKLLSSSETEGQSKDSFRYNGCSILNIEGITMADGMISNIVATINFDFEGEGDLVVEGFLLDCQTNKFVSTLSYVSLSSTNSICQLMFDPHDVTKSSMVGPYNLGALMVTDLRSSIRDGEVIAVESGLANSTLEIDESLLVSSKGSIVPNSLRMNCNSDALAVEFDAEVFVSSNFVSSAFLYSTNGLFVAEGTGVHTTIIGTNSLLVAFDSDEVYNSGVLPPYEIRGLRLTLDGEVEDSTTESLYITNINPIVTALTYIEGSALLFASGQTGNDKIESLMLAFTVSNSVDAVVEYKLSGDILGTNATSAVTFEVTRRLNPGVNEVIITNAASAICMANVNGPYQVERIRFEEVADNGRLFVIHPNVSSQLYLATDFANDMIGVSASVGLDDVVDYDGIGFSINYSSVSETPMLVNAVLVDRDGNFAAQVTTTNFINESSVGKLTFRRKDLEDYSKGPFSIGSMKVAAIYNPDDSFELNVMSLTNILWMVAPPVFSPVTRTIFFSSFQPVVISCATPEAEIRYTLDGTEPTESSLIYDGSLVISNSVTVKARAFAEYMRPSEIVQAEYIHAAIVGGNLVQSDTLSVGVPQTLNIPVPGTYKVSFDYSQGGDIELRLAGNGTTNTLAVIAAASAGSTNFLFDVDKAGKYELIIFDFSLGVTQPADVSSLSICIPDTGRNRSRYWIYETENTFGSTGEWVTESGFVNGKMPVNGSSVFTAAQQSFGRNVTILTTVEFNCLADNDASADELEALEHVKAGITLRRREDGVPSFQVLSIENGQKVWLNVSGAGLSEPILEKPYTIKLTFDCTNRTYEVALVESGGHETPLMHGTTNCFSFAGNTDAAVCLVEYHGGGNMLSLYGKDDYPEASFMQGDVLSFDGSQMPAITEGEAAWLNSMNSYDVVKLKVASMSRQDIEEAYLLNLDITQDVFGLDVFKVSGVEVTETEVRIHVWLNRIGAIQVDNGGGTKNAPINGILRLYGGTTPQTKDLLNATVMTDANFSEGNTATITYPRNGGARFFRPIIESQAD